MTRTITIHIEEKDGKWMGFIGGSGMRDEQYIYDSEDEAREKLTAAMHVAADLMVAGLVTKITSRQVAA